MVRKRVIQNALKTRILSGVAASFIAISLFNGGAVYANVTCTTDGGEAQCADGTNFQVKIPEILTVQVTRPSDWIVGDMGDFLRNTITLNVSSNNAAGFTASMTTAATTAAGAALANTQLGSNSTIPMLTSDWTRANTSLSKFWGYSLNDASETGTYSAVALKGSSTPVTLIPAGTTESASKDIYIGAKADSSIDSGTYQGTLVFSVVSDIITEDNPVIPVDPAVPDDTIADNPTYQPGNSQGDPGRTIYTENSSTSTTNTSTIEVSEGDTRDAYQDPHGVTTGKANEGTPLATGLAVTAAVAAVAGSAFFVIAYKRRKEKEDEDDEF